MHHSHFVDGMFARPIGMCCWNVVVNVVEAEILSDSVYVGIVWSMRARSWGWKLFGMNFVMLFEVTYKEKCECFVGNFFYLNLYCIWFEQNKKWIL